MRKLLCTFASAFKKILKQGCAQAEKTCVTAVSVK